MKKGLSLLTQRLKHLEMKMVMEDTKMFPPYFRRFISLYRLGYGMLNVDMVRINDDELNFFVAFNMFNRCIINDEEYNATIDLVFEMPKLLEEYENYQKKVDHWHDEGLMKIGLMFYGDVLLLGIEDSKKDQIWRYGNGLLNTTCCKLDDDIFSFFSRLEKKIDLDQLEEFGFSKNQLYKNWGEDFWRVRNENPLRDVL